MLRGIRKRQQLAATEFGFFDGPVQGCQDCGEPSTPTTILKFPPSAMCPPLRFNESKALH
ncbi:hypothetical protein [Arthrobacter sp. SO5]|uniref:hypothetical protein n=1 Tax=Arthrobacter sp. SO5 TaxID=1897055 RepID=UPI001E424B8C|nr:hypothetical protein [Arthrobacter sp. SO5]